MTEGSGPGEGVDLSTGGRSDSGDGDGDGERILVVLEDTLENWIERYSQHQQRCSGRNGKKSVNDNDDAGSADAATTNTSREEDPPQDNEQQPMSSDDRQEGGRKSNDGSCWTGLQTLQRFVAYERPMTLSTLQMLHEQYRARQQAAQVADDAVEKVSLTLEEEDDDDGIAYEAGREMAAQARFAPALVELLSSHSSDLRGLLAFYASKVPDPSSRPAYVEAFWTHVVAAAAASVGDAVEGTAAMTGAVAAEQQQPSIETAAITLRCRDALLHLQSFLKQSVLERSELDVLRGCTSTTAPSSGACEPVSPETLEDWLGVIQACLDAFLQLPAPYSTATYTSASPAAAAAATTTGSSVPDDTRFCRDGILTDDEKQPLIERLRQLRSGAVERRRSRQSRLRERRDRLVQERNKAERLWKDAEARWIARIDDMTTFRTKVEHLLSERVGQIIDDVPHPAPLSSSSSSNEHRRVLVRITDRISDPA
jgi:hypothetical protein